MKKMQWMGLATAALSTLLMAAPLRAQEGADVGRATEAAKAWLALVDAADYAASWDQAAGPFQAAVPKPQWQQAISASRQPLGALKSRQPKSASFTRSLPGAPDGEYVVIRFEAQFEHKAQAIETVTPMKDKNGNWKVSGYFIN